MSDELEKLKAELKAAYSNLTSTQERCTELIQENRDLKRRNSVMKAKWLALLEMNFIEGGPDEGSMVMDYNLTYDHKNHVVIIERDVSKPSHRCIEDGHSYGHGDTCFYCGHQDET